MARSLLLAATLVGFAAPYRGGASEPKVGDYAITVVHTSESLSEDGNSSGSSNGHHEYLERVVAVRLDGVERVFDLPREADRKDRLLSWQFPVRVLQATDGTLQILNRAEMVERRDAWLKEAKLPKEACGSWYFTWSAFQVECDPDAILSTLNEIILRPDDLFAGAAFRDPASSDEGRLTLLETRGPARTFKVTVALNPDVIRRENARSDVVVGELTREPVTFETAYRKRAQERVAGTLSVTFDVNSEARCWRRTSKAEYRRQDSKGAVERNTSRQVVARRSLSPTTRDELCWSAEQPTP